MKIDKITKKRDIYTVLFVPNWLEKLFGKQPKTEFYKKDQWKRYKYGGGGVYYNKNGVQVFNDSPLQKALDTFEKSW